MIIKEDYSYLSATDRTAIEQGVAMLAVHSFRLERYIAEEEIAESIDFAPKPNSPEWTTYCKKMRELESKLNSPEWAIHCEKMREEFAAQNEIVLEELEKAGLILGQYHTTPKLIQSENGRLIPEHYDLWFWCLDDKNGRLLDYVTLTRNRYLPIEQQIEIVERAKAVFEKINTTGNCVSIQYEAIYDEQKVAEIAEQFAEEHLGKFIHDGYQIGKIVRIDPELNCGYKYAFMRKNAKKRGYMLGTKELYAISLNNAA